MYMIFLSKL